MRLWEIEARSKSGRTTSVRPFVVMADTASEARDLVRGCVFEGEEIAVFPVEGPVASVRGYAMVRSIKDQAILDRTMGRVI